MQRMKGVAKYVSEQQALQQASSAASDKVALAPVVIDRHAFPITKEHFEVALTNTKLTGMDRFLFCEVRKHFDC